MSRRRSARRSGISELAFLDPFGFIEGLGSLGSQRLRGADLLDFLGEDEEERVETIVDMLRRSSDEDVSELMRIVQQAMQRVALERALD